MPGTAESILKTINKIKSTNLDNPCFGSSLCGSIFALSVGCMTYFRFPSSISKVSQERGEKWGAGAEKLLLIILYLLHSLPNCFLRAGSLAVAALSYNIPSPAPFTHPPDCLSERRTSNPPLSCLAEKQFFHPFKPGGQMIMLSPGTFTWIYQRIFSTKARVSLSVIPLPCTERTKSFSNFVRKRKSKETKRSWMQEF